MRPKKPKKLKETRPILLKINIKWEDAYPFLEEIYKFQGEQHILKRYFSFEDPNVTDFLYAVLRSTCLPTFMKNNLKKIKKYIEKEIEHRDKILEKLEREEVRAFETYFADPQYFERNNDENEIQSYYKHEIEKVYANYLKAYLETGLYESRVRSKNKDRMDFCKLHNIDNNDKPRYGK